MAIIERVEELQDRIRVHLAVHNGVGIADKASTVEVLYSDIPSLPPPPPHPPSPTGYGAE